MTIKLYLVSGAPRPWRVQLGLAFKGLSYEKKILQASKREHKSEAFLKINPRGTIPVLIDRDVVMCDSIGALAWLDRAYPERPLFGETPDEAAAIWQTTTELSDYLRGACHGILHPIFFGDVQEKTPELEEAAKIMAKEIALIDTMLASAPFVCGNTPSAADAVAFPEIRLIQRACDTKPDIMAQIGFGPTFRKTPLIPKRVKDWIRRIEALPGVDNSFPTHW